MGKKMKKWIRSVRKIRYFYRKKYRIVITAVLIVGIVGGMALRAARPVPGGMGAVMAAEQTAAVERQTIMNSITAEGTV